MWPTIMELRDGPIIRKESKGDVHYELVHAYEARGYKGERSPWKKSTPEGDREVILAKWKSGREWRYSVSWY